MARQNFEFKQGRKTYDIYNLPDGFAIKRDIDMSEMDLEELPNLSMVSIEGNFDCHGNRLTSLKGAPYKVTGDFICSENELTSLKGAPQKVIGEFNCSDNNLQNLEGAPYMVEGDFSCARNKLTSLEGAPQKVGGGFYCNVNKLTSLKGAPKEVGGGFVCSKNEIKGLFPAPVVPAGYMIQCDNELGKKYGFSESLIEGISYRDLLESARYKSEVSRLNIALKRQKEIAEGAKKVGSWYADYKKGLEPKDGGRE